MAHGPRRARVRWRVRRATLRDLNLLVENRRHMWEDISGREPLPLAMLDRADRTFRDWAGPRLKDRSLIGFIVEAPTGEVAGTGAIWLQPTHPRPWWDSGVVPYMMAVYTRPQDRGKGVATAMVREMLAWTKKEGHPRLVLHASEMGRGVYARLGFERTWEMRYQLVPQPHLGRRPRARPLRRGGSARPGRRGRTSRGSSSR